MLFDIYVISFLFIVGIFVGLISVIWGLKGPLKRKKDKVQINCCDSCNSAWKWYELIPIFSFFLSRGECPYCHKIVSLYYSALELLMGLLFSFSYMRYGFSYEMIIMIILSILLVNIYVSDFKYYVILDSPLVIFSIIVLVLKYIFFGFETFLISFCSGFLIFLFMMIVRYIGNRIYGRDSLGGGDIKLSMFFGFVLGIRLSIISLIIGSFLAFPYAIYFVLANKEREIPFGPFLVTGLYIVFVFMDVIRTFLMIIF